MAGSITVNRTSNISQIAGRNHCQATKSPPRSEQTLQLPEPVIIGPRTFVNEALVPTVNGETH